uniref:Uncharacterized protein n=1 Tax=Arundo donax TaxID=35708 RepID=A0A0A8XPF9_ARUDO
MWRSRPRGKGGMWRRRRGRRTGRGGNR